MRSLALFERLDPSAERRHTARRRAAPLRPCLELLEDRLCPSGGYLVVASYDNNSIFRYDEGTGAFVNQIDPKNMADLKQPVGLVFGPDHNLYVSDRQFLGNPQVLQYDGTTGAFRSLFASQNLGSPRGILFGPDGNIYVADGGKNSNGNATVDRFDGRTGAFLNYFVALGSGGLAHPGFMAFGPDGNLYVGDVHVGAVLRYYGPNAAQPGAPDPAPGQSGAVFVPPASGGLDSPQGLVFGPDGNLYVSSANFFTSSNGPAYSGPFPPGAVLKFEGPSGPNPGAFLGTFVAGGYGGLANPEAVLFGPAGDLYVSSCVESGQSGNLFLAEPGTSVVLRYDGTTGTFLGTFITPDSGGLACPISMSFTETDPTTLNYDGATTSTSAALAQPATNTTTSTASLTGAIDGLALVGLPSGGLPRTAGVVLVSLPPAQPFAPAPLAVPPLTSNLPPARPAGSSQPGLMSEAASDQGFATLDAQQPFARLVDDLALTGWGPDDLTPARPRA